MPTQGPLILLQSSYDCAGGIVPPALLVQAAAEAGFRTAAITDTETLRGTVSFLEACAATRLLGLVGMTVHLIPTKETDHPKVSDVFDLSLSIQAEPGRPGERVALLAINQTGYRNLIKIKQKCSHTKEMGLASEDLLECSEGVFLVTGLPGSILCRTPPNRLDSQRFAWITTFLEKWPHDQAGLCCFDSHTGGIIETVTTTTLKQPLPVPPLACVSAAYRTQNDRFWGFASLLSRRKVPLVLKAMPGRIPRADRVTRILQGLSSSFRGVEKLIAKPFDPCQRSGLNFPVYPVPRGTDVASFFWTLGQETAITTGHIRQEGVKDRLVEEFQYLKQTRWPIIWLILWDIRKRLGLPPGTLRPTAEWIGSSLFAHLLGLTRIDPCHEGIPFRPEMQTSPANWMEVDCPSQWEKEILSELNALLGRGRCGFTIPDESSRDDLLAGGYRLLSKWADLEMPGNPPDKIPPLPSFIDQSEAYPAASTTSLVVSGANLEHIFAPAPSGYLALDTNLDDALSIGTLGLQLLASNAQTLASAPLYRGTVPTVPRHEESRESITSWIEKHRGEEFHDQGYSDDTGRIEILGLSSSLLRLLTLPGSMGYRPLLWKWIQSTSPTYIGELADLLALAWHWTFWTQREDLRLLASQREHPLRSEGGLPPWWEFWTRFADEGGLDSKIRGDFGAALEQATEGTGGWVLYREQIHRVGIHAFRLTPVEMDSWLCLEEENLNQDLAAVGNQRVWDRNTREVIIQFLGNPNPLPTRLEFLRKAEQLLAMVDAYAQDPAAVTAILSFLYPEEIEDRREMYSLLKARGTRLDLPRAVPGGRFDLSPSKDLLRLGTQVILGVGPQISTDLETPYGSGTRDPELRDLFSPPQPIPPITWEEWLKVWPEHRLSWNLLSQMIRLGVFESFGSDVDVLLSEARGRYRFLRAQGGWAAQQTLFSVQPESSTHVGPVLSQTGTAGFADGRIETDLLRMGITQSPLDPFRHWFTSAWFEESTSERPESLQMGWLHELDLFAPVSEPEMDGSLQPPWVSFLLFNQEGVSRIVDETGKVMDLIPGPLPDPLRLDGHRIHLREPYPILCEVYSRPYTGQGLPQFVVRECETPSLLVQASQSWREILVILEDSSSDLLDRISQLLRWFSDGREGIPLTFENGAGLLKRSGVRRLIARLGLPQVAPSRVLISRLKGLRGVRSVEVIHHQTDLFGPE